MAVTKRLRYEILRRDNHTCRYCGAKAPDVELTVDHVTPRALGGTDTPDNLVASCRGCNTGKSSSIPDGPLVADVSAEALQWATAVRSALREMSDEDWRLTKDTDRFIIYWEEQGSAICQTGVPYPPDAWETINRFLRYGMTYDHLDWAMQMAMWGTPGVGPEDAFRYFCGICWNKIREAERRAAER